MQTSPRRLDGEGSAVSRNERQRPTPNTPKTQLALSDEADKLLENLKADPDTIRRLRFYESESKIALRERLQNAMLASADRGGKARSERACVRFWDINATANFYVLSNASEAALAEVVDILRREFDAAEAWDRLEGGK